MSRCLPSSWAPNRGRAHALCAGGPQSLGVRAVIPRHTPDGAHPGVPTVGKAGATRRKILLAALHMRRTPQTLDSACPPHVHGNRLPPPRDGAHAAPRHRARRRRTTLRTRRSARNCTCEGQDSPCGLALPESSAQARDIAHAADRAARQPAPLPRPGSPAGHACRAARVRRTCSHSAPCRPTRRGHTGPASRRGCRVDAVMRAPGRREMLRAMLMD